MMVSATLIQTYGQALQRSVLGHLVQRRWKLPGHVNQSCRL